MKNGLLIVVSAPSGCGKGTILSEILKNDNYFFSVSATTRKPREGEEDGVNYYFLTKDQFENNIKNNGMLEYAEYCGNYYGTPKEPIEKNLSEGKNVILEIEVNGAMQIRKKCPDAVFLFIMPPSIKELDRRLHKRGTETEEVIASRISQAKKEMTYAKNYDYIVVNDALEDAVDDFKSIVRACQCKVENNEELLSEVK